ncbi:cupin domain-containing protein [Pusillimonas caeni]|uniref:cupin domain-containing protein n=1 Tax=Pusillimonas caeni TaxID=1348472 RepID=UPI000E59C625|nr:cupin domain-containing protein [Pusillimonas caeni]TFL10037.1 cupin domain-containing protein [Pusillimonas caeni]
MTHDDTPAQRLIRQLGLLPHPEGGYYRETYRSSMGVTTQAGRRDASTAIYYLLEGKDHSAWHRIASDELWHFYAGSALNIHVLNDEKGLSTHRLGDPLREPGCVFQAAVPAGCWFAAELASHAMHRADDAARDAFALVGCTVAPGFEFSEFELADTRALIRRHPQHADLMARLAPATARCATTKAAGGVPPAGCSDRP